MLFNEFKENRETKKRIEVRKVEGFKNIRPATDITTEECIEFWEQEFRKAALEMSFLNNANKEAE